MENTANLGDIATWDIFILVIFFYPASLLGFFFTIMSLRFSHLKASIVKNASRDIYTSSAKQRLNIQVNNPCGFNMQALAN
jgi:hypothetical protein